METVPRPDVETAVAGAPVGRRRRPSGEAPPLPRHVDTTMRLYVVLVVLTAGLWVTLWTRLGQAAVTRVDLVVVHAAAGVRTGLGTSIARAAAVLGSSWTIRVIAWTTIAVLVATRRFRHLFVYMVVLLGIEVLGTAVMALVGRMRPAGVTFLGPWQAYADPSLSVAALAVVVAGVLYTLLPRGRPRDAGKLVGVVALAALCCARLYLGVDHPTDLAAALVAGWALPVLVFRLLTPDEVFPVSYKGGQRAHLEIAGRRHDAIVQALDSQLGLDAAAVEPVGLEGSAGSTPLRIRLRSRSDDGEEGVLFGKLYAVSHLRSDRWYKFTRTIFYGRLEDEKPFASVRRLVEYEDHMLRLMRDAGLPTPAPYGFVEITPEREYVIVMQFFDGARPILGEVLDEAAIDDGLSVVRRLWDAGLAHRDIKPSNLLRRGDNVLLIDVAFAAVRPTPWRQAVDLANMMLTLALCSTPELVYERALAQFTPDDVAEAFAACRSVTVPTQLRARLRADGRDLPDSFRRLAPARSPVSIQLWNTRRVGITAGVFALTALAVGLLIAYSQVAGLLGGSPTAGDVPGCAAVRRVAVVAQSVRTATYVPCRGQLEQGWSTTGFDPGSNGTQFTLTSDRAPGSPVHVAFAKQCNAADATPTTPRANGVRTSIRLRSISPRYAGTMFDVFPGGCVTTTFDFVRGPHIALMEGVDSALALASRRQLRIDIHRELGVELDP